MESSDILRIRGRHYLTGQPVELAIQAATISAVDPIEPGSGESLSWLAPGFIDLQSNGYGGQEFSSPVLSVDKVRQICNQQPAFGVTRLLPTVTTASSETLSHSLKTIARACRELDEVRRLVPGIHLEGPYITTEDGPRGAHPRQHCRPPDWQEFCRFQDAADGLLRLVTLSPEYPESPGFIAQAVASGVVVAIGHTAANSDQIRAAVDAGASLSTHLGNGAHRMLRRHPNYLWDQLADDRLMASLIVDGHHLPAEVVKSMVRAKTPQRCILVSDLSGLAGLAPGRYDTELCELEILPDGRLVIAGQDQLLAGASRPIGVGIAKVMQFAEIDLPTAVAMATSNPALLMGWPTPQMVVGQPADCVAFDLLGDESSGPRLLVRETIISGSREFSDS